MRLSLAYRRDLWIHSVIMTLSGKTRCRGYRKRACRESSLDLPSWMTRWLCSSIGKGSTYPCTDCLQMGLAPMLTIPHKLALLPLLPVLQSLGETSDLAM